MFIIKTLKDEYTCASVNRNRFATSKWLLKTYTQQFKDSESWAAPNFITEFRKTSFLNARE